MREEYQEFEGNNILRYNGYNSFRSWHMMVVPRPPYHVRPTSLRQILRPSWEVSLLSTIAKDGHVYFVHLYDTKHAMKSICPWPWHCVMLIVHLQRRDYYYLTISWETSSHQIIHLTNKTDGFNFMHHAAASMESIYADGWFCSISSIATMCIVRTLLWLSISHTNEWQHVSCPTPGCVCVEDQGKGLLCDLSCMMIPLWVDRKLVATAQLCWFGRVASMDQHDLGNDGVTVIVVVLPPIWR